jgi:hypothetical protein
MTAAFNQMLAQGPTPIKFADPVNQMAQLMQLKNYQQTGVVNQMAIDKGQRQQADQAAYRNMLAQPGFNSTDPTTRAQVLGLGYGDDLTAMDASAKTQQDLAKTAYDERAASYKAGAPFNATAQQYLDYFDAGAQDPVLGAHWENNEGGIAPMRARLVQLLSTPEGLAHVREMAGGQTQAGQDTHDVAMAKIAEATARAAKAGRPDAPSAATRKTLKFDNGQAYEYDPVTGTIRALSLAGSAPAAGSAAAVGPTSATGFPTPPKAAPTEAEAAGAGAGTRILGATNLIGAAVAADPAAAAPTGAEAFLGGIPVVRRVVPSIQSGERQVVQNSYGDLVDAALYLATGASATPEQKAAAMDAYSPAYLDKPEEIAAKKQRLVTLIESAKTRAGRAWTPEQESQRKQIVAALNSAVAAGGGPAVGTVEDNHRFKGGDPAKAENWEPL